MLQSLHIENLAVIHSLDLDLKRGLTAFTGETGSGKTIILEGIRLLLGARGDKDLIRHGEKTARITGVFGPFPEDFAAFSLLDIEPDEDGCLFLQRTLDLDGKSTVKINGRAVTLSLVRALGMHLVSIHGQNASSELLNPETHLLLLDSYANLSNALEERYRPLYEGYLEASRALSETEAQIKERERMEDILRYQITEIESLGPKSGEEERLLEKRAVFRNREKIDKQAGFVYKALIGAEKGSVHYLLSRSIHALEALSDILPNAEKLIGDLAEAIATTDDVAETVYAAADLGSDEDPGVLLDRIESRLEGYARLHRKYGADTEEVLRFYREAKQTLENYSDAEGRLRRLKKEKKEAYLRVLEIANEISMERRRAAKQLEEKIMEILRFLDMPKAICRIRVEENRREDGEAIFSPTGLDRITFLVSANIGEEPKSIAEAVSGGELSRIMLAIESVLSEKSGVPTVIYDEADTGVSGKTARKIGLKMKETACKKQVFTITHSAQIASLADTHFLVEKHEEEGRTVTSAQSLSPSARIEELARILGGLHVTEVQRNAARALLDGGEL